MKTKPRKDTDAAAVVANSASGWLASGVKAATLRNRHAHYTHQLPEESTEAASRLLVRVVPLVFGAMLGSVGNNLAVALAAALAISVAFDLSMADKSIARRLYRRSLTEWKLRRSR